MVVPILFEDGSSVAVMSSADGEDTFCGWIVYFRGPVRGFSARRTDDISV